MMRSDGIIFMLHCESNTGFAIEKLESAFYDAALAAGYSPDRVFFSYPAVSKGRPRWMPSGFENWMEYDFDANVAVRVRELRHTVRAHNIRTAFIFDVQPQNPVNRILRHAGVKRVLAYWGAPMSSLNQGAVLLAKRIEVLLRRHGPDKYIFESKAMLETATRGRGIARTRCCVIPTGVDTDRFHDREPRPDLYSKYSIPRERRIFVYSGHMEERKGVHVIVKAMDHLVGHRRRRDIHFLAFGNRDNDERRFYQMLTAPEAAGHITFGGYTDRLQDVFRSAFAGVVASTGWDSWPMSVIEMGASGLPLLVSDLQGLKEFVVDEVNGFRFTPGCSEELAQRMVELVDEPERARAMGVANRQKVLSGYSRSLQVSRLAAAL